MGGTETGWGDLGPRVEVPVGGKEHKRPGTSGVEHWTFQRQSLLTQPRSPKGWGHSELVSLPHVRPSKETRPAETFLLFPYT